MKKLLFVLIAISSIGYVQAQDKQVDIIKKAANEMAWGLYSASGSQQILADQAERQIKEQIAAHPELSQDEVITNMIKETQEENIDYAWKANSNWAELSFCEEALGEEVTNQSDYVSQYSKEKVDAIQESLSGKVKQLTVETYIQASLIGKQIEYTLKAGQCKDRLKALVKKAKEDKSCEESSTSYGSSPAYAPQNMGMSIGSSYGIGF